MPALLLRLLTGAAGKWIALAGLIIVVALAGWGGLERLGRLDALRQVADLDKVNASLTARIRNLETRNGIDEGVRREPDPSGRLRDEWSRPD